MLMKKRSLSNAHFWIESRPVVADRVEILVLVGGDQIGRDARLEFTKVFIPMRILTTLNYSQATTQYSELHTRGSAPHAPRFWKHDLELPCWPSRMRLNRGEEDSKEERKTKDNPQVRGQTDPW
jgi:hypothetical protein